MMEWCELTVVQNFGFDGVMEDCDDAASDTVHASYSPASSPLPIYPSPPLLRSLRKNAPPSLAHRLSSDVKRPGDPSDVNPVSSPT